MSTTVSYKGSTIATLSNETKTLTTSGKWMEADVVITDSGGTPSATAHTIYFEFSDNTNTTITAYYDSTFISSAITATTPTTYGSKTVNSAQLDGVAWYTRPTETWETLWNDSSTDYYKDNNFNYPYLWLSELSDVYPTDGSVWRITFNGTEYRCVAKTVSGTVLIGNPKWGGQTDDGSNVPFNFYNKGWGAWSGSANLENIDQNIPVKIERLVTS